MPIDQSDNPFIPQGGLDSGITDFDEVDLTDRLTKTLELFEHTPEAEQPFRPLNLHNLYWFPPISDQGNTKACAAFAFADLIQFYESDINQRQLIPAIGWMHVCVGEKALNTGVPMDSLYFNLARKDLLPQVEPGYPLLNTDCNRLGCFELLKLGYYNFSKAHESTAKMLLINRRPFVTGLAINRNFQSWTGNTPYIFDPLQEPFDHAVLVYGFDEEHWLCRNTMGSSWGNQGHFRVPFGKSKLCIEKFKFFTFNRPV